MSADGDGHQQNLAALRGLATAYIQYRYNLDESRPRGSGQQPAVLPDLLAKWGLPPPVEFNFVTTPSEKLPNPCGTGCEHSEN